MSPASLGAILYLVVVAIIALRRDRLDDRSLLHIFVVYAPGVAWLVPLAWLIANACLAGDATAVLTNGLTLALIVFTLMGLQLKRRPGLQPVGRRLRVVTFNVFGGSIDIDKCLAYLKRADADIIFLQEAWWTFRHRAVDTLPRIEAAFADWHRFRSADEHELMILSRHPLAEMEKCSVANRPCLTATAKIPAGDVRLVNVHLDPPATRRTLAKSGKPVVEFVLDTARARELQGDALHALIQASSLPTVVAGDFNSPPHAYARRVLAPLLRDVFAATGHGFGYTYPHPMPLWRIDYILVSPSIVPQACYVPAVDGSDHRPTVADLRLPS